MPVTARCPTCNTRISCDRDEDGRPALPGQPCAEPTCEAWLCPVCLEHFSFVCECGRRLCMAHLVLVDDGTPKPLKCCAACAATEIPCKLPEVA